MLFDIRNPLPPLGLMIGREQTRKAWRQRLVLITKVGYCRSAGPLPCHGTARGNRKEREGIGRNQTT
jgi:hypothetical protein